MYSAEVDAEGMERLTLDVAEKPATDHVQDGAAPARCRHRGACRGSGWCRKATTHAWGEQIAETSQQRKAGQE